MRRWRRARAPLRPPVGGGPGKSGKEPTTTHAGRLECGLQPRPGLSRSLAVPGPGHSAPDSVVTLVPGTIHRHLCALPSFCLLGPDVALEVYRKQENKSFWASRKTKKKEGGGLRAQRASSNVFSNFEQTQIQEFKEAFTLMDQNRDGFIDKEDLKDTYASLGKTNVKDDELDAMLKEASGPINFTMFLNMFGAKLTGTDAEETILNAFKMLDPEGKGSINKDYIKRLLMSQADKMTAEEVDQMFQFATIDAAGNLDYKALSYVLTHGEEKEE
ncbi:myosin light chain 5 [Panthera uncia]|uniref:myosin light chain 5 n=1 Tax=Panthera uncia TaxID=29064 RepID=UPI0020FFBE6A|nr:myosin light chain 5 [Panthera uncia]